ncbi:MAG: ribosome biogenesis GTPase YlqF [Anaerorhabdus sp.]
MTIQWFPGHMTKAKRLMESSLKMVDLVIEIRDARIPMASRNPMLESIIQNKPKIILFSKKDKADNTQTKKWVEIFHNKKIKVIPINLLSDNVTNIIISACKDVMKEKIDKQISRGIKPRAIRAMVVGIPNVGKSTLINRIVKKKIAATANKPGVTRSLQWIKLNNDVELLDTPGVLWPKFEDIEVGYYLSLTGAIRDQVVNLEDIAIFAIKKMKLNYPGLIMKRYNVDEKDDDFKILNNICLFKNFLLKNNEPDLERCIVFFLKEIRDDKFGQLTWEFCDGK